MHDDSMLAQQYLSVGEIAALVGVRPSAVSNWRKRSRDFPLPTESVAGADIFEREAVTNWLQRNGKQISTSDSSLDRALWSISRLFNNNVEDAALLTLQVIYLRMRMRQPDPSHAALAEFWKNARTKEHAFAAWSDVVAALAEVTPSLEKILSIPSGITEDELRRAIGTLANENDADVQWGPLATRMLRRYEEMAGMQGMAGGERSVGATPASVTTLMVSLLQPLSGTVYDPACGMGMVLAEAWEHRASKPLRLVGQEANYRSWRLGYLHLAIHRTEFKLAKEDTLQNDEFRKLQADRVIVDPPMGARVDVRALQQDVRWSYGVPRTSSDWLWAQQALFHLADDGIAAVVMPLTALSRAGQESQTRQAIVQAALLDVVIELPPGLWAGTSVATAMLLFAKGRRTRSDRVLFIAAQQLGSTRRGKIREFTQADNSRVMTVVDAWRSGTLQTEPHFAATATVAEISQNEWDLSPSRYVGHDTLPITAIDGEQVSSRLERLRGRLSEAVKDFVDEQGRAVDGAHVTLARRTGGEPTVVDSFAALQDGASMFVHDEHAKWPTERIGSLLVSDPCTGMRQELEKPGEEVPYIHTKLVSGGSGHLFEIPQERTRGTIRGRLAKRGDLLLASRGIEAGGRIGCATVHFDGAAAFAESLMRLRFDSARVHPDYLRLWLTSRQGRATLVSVTTGSVISNLRGKALEEVRVPLPPLAIQSAIVAGLQRIEAGLSQLSTILKDSGDLFDALREAVAAGTYVPK